jgi:hypothetical protein
MKRMRFLVALLVIWLIFFYSIEQVSEPVNISRVAYPFAPLMAILIVLIPRLRKVPLWILLIVPISVFLTIKLWTGYGVLGADFPFTVTEVCVISVTTILAHLISIRVSEFEDTVARITIGQASDLPDSYEMGRAKMYREVKRARHHQRPLTVMAIGVEEESVRVALDRMVQEAQQTMMRQYVLCSVAKVLCNSLEDYNTIAQKDEHLVILLPELTLEESESLVNQLSEAVSKQVGVALKIGLASFPRDAVTSEHLVEKAIEGMDGKRETASPKPASVEARDRRVLRL